MAEKDEAADKTEKAEKAEKVDKTDKAEKVKQDKNQDQEEIDLHSYTEYDWFVLRFHLMIVGVLLVTASLAISLMIFLKFWAVGIFAAMLPVFLTTIFIRVLINYLVKIQFGITPSMPMSGWRAVNRFLKENFTPGKRKQISTVVIGISAAGLLMGALMLHFDNEGILSFPIFLTVLGIVLIYLSLLKSDIEDNL
ncbi:MAG: hypothetical protein LWY06_13240 [Firmicutes bacterium]|nr:hypothetical protein [Bacillota bacterium]